MRRAPEASRIRMVEDIRALRVRRGQNREQPAMANQAAKQGGSNNRVIDGPPVAAGQRQVQQPAGGGIIRPRKEQPAARRIQDIFAGHDLELASGLYKDVFIKVPGVCWDDIAGLEEAKRVLTESVVWPLIQPNMFRGILRPPLGVLLFGPPGTGKTLLAKAVATECKTTFFSVSSSTLANRFRGESERMVKILFDMARYFAPSTIFIDEIDSLCGSHGGDSEHEASRRVTTEFLVQINGCNNSAGEDGAPPPYVMVLAATNRPWKLDKALVRRMEKRIFITLPNQSQIKTLLELNLKDYLLDCDLKKLAAKMDGYSGVDVFNVCRDAAMNGIREVLAGKSLEEIRDMRTRRLLPVTDSDFDMALQRERPSVAKGDVKKYLTWMQKRD